MSNAQDIPVWEKYTLTIEEASKYFRIGENKLPWVYAAIGIHPESLLAPEDCGEEGPAPTVSVFGGDWAAEMKEMCIRDRKYARQTAEYLGSEHHEIIINRDMVISSLEEVIRLLGTWDITTIRASMGMYLLCKAIHEQTDVRVLLTGEISDELFGYKYTDYAPTMCIRDSLEAVEKFLTENV